MRFLPVLVLLFCFSSANAQADSGNAPWQTYGDRITASRKVSGLGDDRFGDQISLSNGALSFAATDVSLPGAGPAIAFGRTYTVRDMRQRVTVGELGDWHVALPSISAIHATDWIDDVGGTSRCSLPGAPPESIHGAEDWDFWQGPTIDIPGVTGGEI